MPRLLLQRPVLSMGDTDSFSVDLTKRLDSAETLTSPTVIECDIDGDAVTGGTLTVADVQVNSAAYDDANNYDANGNATAVSVGKAVQFTLSTSQTLPDSKFVLVTANSTGGAITRTLQRMIKIEFK